MRFPFASAPHFRLSLRLSVLSIALLGAALLLTACQDKDEQVKALLASGKSYAEKNQQAEAVIEFRKALQIDPNRADAHMGLGESYAALGNGQQALWEFSETVRLDPSNTDARLKLGAIALIGKDYQQALDQGTAVIAAKPDVAQAYVLHGQALEGLSRANEAESDYLKAVQLEPESGSLLHVLAGYYVRVGKRDAAEPLFVKWTEVEPSFTSETMLGRFLAADPSRDKTAVAAFEKALELAKPENLVEGYQNLAQIHAMRGRTDEAAQVLQKGIQATDKDPKAKVKLMYTLARLYAQVKREDDATRLIEEATKVDPNDVEAYLLLSMDRSRRGDVAGALEAAEHARKVAPDDPKATVRCAELQLQIGVENKQPEHVVEAEKLVDQVLAKEPSNADAQFVKARIDAANKDYDKAIELFRSTIDARPDWAMAHYLLGSTLALSGNTSGARAEVSRAVELDPTLDDAIRLLAQLHSALGESEYAVEQGRKYLNRHPDPQMRLLVAQNLAKLGRTDEALKAAGRIPDKRSSPGVLVARARLFLAAKKTKEAHDLLLIAVDKAPADAQVLELLLDVEADMNQLPRAGKRIEAAAQAHPDDSELARVVGVYQLRKGDDAAAESAFRKAIDLDPKNLAAYQQLGQLYDQTGRVKESVATYEKAVQQRPDSAQLHYFLGTLYEAQGRSDDAAAKYEKALALKPDFVEAKNNLAYLLADSGTNLDRALDLAQEAKAAMPDSPGAADTLGWVLYRRGIPSAAVGYLREAVAGTPADTQEMAVVSHHLALAYEANNQKDLAIQTLEQSLDALKKSQAKARAAGEKPKDPAWSASAREMLARLKAAS